MVFRGFKETGGGVTHLQFINTPDKKISHIFVVNVLTVPVYA